MTWDYYDIKKKPDNITGVEIRRRMNAESYKKLVAWLQKNYNKIFEEYMDEQLENRKKVTETYKE
tara:strand:+ start:12658 stop:12852 length:195 start_codon:yes stop_codon:yes gene_type:complete